MTNDALINRHCPSWLFRYPSGRPAQREASTLARESAAVADTAAIADEGASGRGFEIPALADTNPASGVHRVHYSEIHAGALRWPGDHAAARVTTGRTTTGITSPSGPVQQTWRSARSSSILIRSSRRASLSVLQPSPSLGDTHYTNPG